MTNQYVPLGLKGYVVGTYNIAIRIYSSLQIFYVFSLLTFLSFSDLHGYVAETPLAACNGAITALKFSNDTLINDNDIFLTTMVSNPIHLEAIATGSPGSMRFEITGAVTADTTDNLSPWHSSSFNPIAGDYTVTITVYENASLMGAVCEVAIYNFTISEPFSFSFVEDAASWGIDLDKGKDGGHAFGDYDNDDDFDLVINTTHGTTRSRLYRNNGDKTFTDITASKAPSLTLAIRERSTVWGDANNDGLLDFLRNTHGNSTSSVGAIELYLQDATTGNFGKGTGGTTPVKFGYTAANDVNIGRHNIEEVGFIDFDGDGDLDIIFDNHDFGTEIVRNNFINHTTGAIVDPVASALFTHITTSSGTSFGLPQSATDGDYGSLTDVDDDGWVDVLMRKNDKEDFYHNAGGIFNNLTEIGDAKNSNKGGVALADFDNDGDFDIFWTDEGDNRMFRNDVAPVFTALSVASTGIDSTYATDIDEAVAGDMDNDGDIDLLLVGDNRSYFYINQLNDPILGYNVGLAMSFILDDSHRFNIGENGEATSLIDIDDDGDLDVYMSIHNDNNMLWINGLYDTLTTEASKNYLRVFVHEDRSTIMKSGKTRPATGATVVLEDCRGNIVSGVREINGGTGHGTQHPHTVFLGLPQGRHAQYLVRVKYPNYGTSGSGFTRETVAKYIVPSKESSVPLTMNVYATDEDDACPRKIVSNLHLIYLKHTN